MKRFLSIVLVMCLIAAVALTGCGSATSETKDTGTGSSSSGGGTKADGGSTSTDTAGGDRAISHDKELTIDNYNVAANYHGIQSGWFGKVLKDKFNIRLNILAPQVAGDALYQTRVSSGNLGDIVLLEGPIFADCVQNKLIKDISDEISNWPHLMEYKNQIDVYNKGIPGNDAGKIYGIPCQMTNTSPTAYSQDVIYSSPQLRWDLYQQIGMPEIADLNGLLDALEAMQRVHPKNDDGEPAYAMTLWPDWDGGDNMMGIANVVQLTTWYGEKIKGSVVLKPDGTFYKLTDKDGTYRKMLRFLYDAQQRGLVDPDSMDQDWNAVHPKISSGRVHLLWYSWQQGFWNTQERLTQGNAFIFIPVKDQYYYADSDTYYGSGRVFGVGSNVDGEKYLRIMEFLDWYASPEGLEYQHNGIEGFTYTRGADGKMTRMNDNALMDNLPVPEEFGGGGYNDGNNAINQWIVDAISINPNTGEPYASTYWASYKAATQTEMKRQWTEKFGANEPAEWMKKNNKLLVSPNVSVSLPTDPNDIAVVRNSCEEILEEYSWKMIFCGSDEKFDDLWDEMVQKMDGNGFDQVVQFDREKWQIELDAKNAASGK
jgi:multiple sugar transport system substrate-binding protein/putative aldouronate transport system substrate-binding protein